MQDTINSIAFGEDVVELIERTGSEEKEKEKEFNEEIEYISNEMFIKFKDNFNLLGSYDSLQNLLLYNSPIRAVLTPPPNNLS